MQSIRLFFLTVIVAMATLILFGCNLPAATPTPVASGTVFASTISALQTRAVETATAQGYGVPLTPAESATPAVPITGQQQNPVVINDTLCWIGPGPQYEVVSAIFKNTAVSMLGRSTIPGWFIVRNPTYGDPCWIQATDIQLPPGFDVSVLPLFNPPATVTPTGSPTPLVSSTPTGTPAPLPSATPTPPAPTSTP